ncbi:MAG: hypothetical protein M3178_05855 [Pseudomonadota bacterium]|nr:hypothetical protein [Pseudomonadota bacterium]
MNRVFPGTERLNNDSASLFFTLLAAANIPNQLESRESDAFFLASLIRPEAVAKYFIGGAPSNATAWAGANETEVQASRKAFFTAYADAIKNLPPTPPFKLSWLERARLGDYDADRGGFPIVVIGSGIHYDPHTHLEIERNLKSAGLKPVAGFAVPELFWPVDQARAQSLLPRNGSRTVELAAIIDLQSINPDTGEISLKLENIALYADGHHAKLYDFSLSPQPSGGLESSVSALSEPPPIADPANTAAQDKGAAVNGADAARRFDLPTVKGLPLITPIELHTHVSAEGFGGDYGFATTSGLRPLSPAERWARAIHALGLANTPGIAGALDDKDAVGLACIFLPRAIQTRLFQQNSCGFKPNVPGAEFALKDGAAAFRAQELGKIIATAPRLPLKTIVVLPVSISEYDFKKARFSIDYRSESQLSLFGSPLDMVLPSFWPLGERQARAYLATQSDSHRKAWAGIEVALTGVAPGQGTASIFYGYTGLPNHAYWRLLTTDVTLFLDEGLRSPLHKFGGEFARLPQPILNTPDEQAPHPQGPMRLNDETVLLSVLPRLAGKDVKIDWAAAAKERFIVEEKFRSRSDWRDFDPWGVFFSTSPDISTVAGDAELIERYRRWTELRSGDMPKSFTLWRLLPLSGARGTPSQINIFSNSGSLVGGYNDEQYSQVNPGTAVAKLLEARGINKSQLVPMPIRLPWTRAVSVVAVLPQPVQSYVMDTSEVREAFAPDGPQPNLVVECGLDGVDVLDYDNGGKRLAIVLKLTPMSADIRQGSAVNIRYAFPSASEQRAAVAAQEVARKAEAEAAAAKKLADLQAKEEASRASADSAAASVRTVAASALAGVPYGPDILGIQLGMRMSDAEAIIRKHMSVGRVLATDRSSPNGTAKTSLGALRIFVNAGESEQISLLHTSSDIVLGIKRMVKMTEATSDEQLRDMLKAKYGKPSEARVYPGGQLWEFGNGKGKCLTRWHVVVGDLKLIEGPPATSEIPAMRQTWPMDLSAGFEWLNMPEALPALADWAICQPRVEVRRDGSGLSEAMYDARIFVAQRAEALAKEKNETEPPKL